MRGLGSPAAGGCGCETGLHDQPGSAGKGGCSAGCRHRPRALCRTAAAAAAASGPGTETVPVCAATEEAVADTVSSWSTMHRCESIGRVDWAAAGSLPPSKSLLLYLVRMGSFTSAPKIANEDQADCDLELETQQPTTREELLARCRRELQSLPPQLKRSFTGRYQEKPGPETIRVLQWNLLSQALAEQADGFACCPDAALDWSKRRWRILEEILSYQPDLVCLQEVDHYKFLSASLGSVGFDGTFFPKPDSPCCYVRGNNGPDGCAIFYDRTKFELVRCEKRVLEVFTCQSNQVTLLCVFRRKLDDAQLCLVTTHLKARQGGLLSSLRNEQGKDLLDFVRAHRGQMPTIIAGDFNAEPSEPVYRTLLAQRDLQLESSYAVKPGTNIREQEPPYTTWKIRREGEVRHTIDYIFFSKPDLKLEARLDFPTEDQIGPGRVPSLAYASDHFSLVSDLSLPFRISDQQVNELLREEGTSHGAS